MKNSYFIIFFFLFFFSSSYASLSQKYRYYIHSLVPQRMPHKFFIAGNRPAGVLGLGWSSDNNAVVGNCFYGAVDHVGTPAGSVSMGTLYDYDSVMSQLKFKTNGNFSLPGFKMGSAVNYSHMLQDTDYSRTFIYRSSVFLKNRRFVAPKNKSPLTWIGQQYAKNPAAFRFNCGDKFIAEQRIGGLLYVAVKFYFRTKQEKTKFNGYVKSAFSSLGGLNANLSRVMDSIHKDGGISVTAFQIGGDPTKLGHMLGVKKGSYEASVLNCSFDNLGACLAFINQILNYATDRGEDGFLAQFKEDNPESLVGPGVISNILQNTSTLVPVKIGSSLVTKKIREARASISEKYEESLKQINAINHIITSGEPFSADYIQRLKTLKINAELNNKILRRAGQACFEGDLSQCLFQEKSALQKIKVIDLTPFQRKFIVIANVPGYLSPYSDHQMIYGSRNRYFIWEVFSVKTLTPENISLMLPTMWIKGSSSDNGLTYRSKYYNRATNYSENMTLIPDFEVADS